MIMKLFFNQLAQLITNAGGVGAVVDYINDSKGNVRLPGIMMLGYVAAHSETLAMSVIVSKVCILFSVYIHYFIVYSINFIVINS